MDKTHIKESTLSHLDRFRIEMVCKNIEAWDCVWKSVEENVYMSMTDEEMRKFNASLNVIANNMMNTLSALRKSLACDNSSSNSGDSFIRFMRQNINPDS